MRSRAIEAGRALIAAERELDLMFQQKAVDGPALAKALDTIGRRQADVRRVHLEAHLSQRALLTPAQVQRYGELRGYGESAGHGKGQGHDRRH